MSDEKKSKYLKKAIKLYENPNQLANFIGELPDPSVIISEILAMGLSVEQFYTELTHDGQILSLIQRVSADLDKFEYQVVSEGKSNLDKIALELCQSIFYRNRSDTNWEFFKACLFGYRTIQFNYRYLNNTQYVVPDQFSAIPNEFIFFDRLGNPYISKSNQSNLFISSTSSTSGERLSGAKYRDRVVVIRYLPDITNPYGISLLDACFYYYIFKKNGIKSLALFVEQFSNPPVFAKLAEDVETDKNEIASQLKELHLMGTGVFDEGIDINVLESRHSSNEFANNFVMFLNQEMAKVFTGQAQVGEQAQVGSYASDKVADDVAKDVSEKRRRMVANAWNSVFEATLRVNFPEQYNEIAVPQFEFIIESEPRQAWAEFFTELSKQGSIKIPTEFYYDKLRIDVPDEVKNESSITLGNTPSSSIPKNDDDEPNSSIPQDDTPSFNNIRTGNSIEFAKKDDITPLEEMATRSSREFAKSLDDEVIQGLESELKSAKSLKGYRAFLEETYEDVDPKKKDNTVIDVYNSLVFSRLYGLFEVQAEIAGEQVIQFAASDDINDIPVNIVTAIDYLQNKTDVPTKTWKDIDRDSNHLSFSIAGASEKDLITDLHTAVNLAIKEGSTINEFRKRFDDIVAAYGWSYIGNRNWRTAVIFNTNMASARSFERYTQQWAVREDRRWLRYVTAGDNRVRADHRVLAGIVRPIDDGFWDFYYPPNGYRCRCAAVSYDDRQLDRNGLTETKFKKFNDNEIVFGNNRIGTYTKDGKTYREGVTAGFDSSPKDYIETVTKATQRPKTL